MAEETAPSNPTQPSNPSDGGAEPTQPTNPTQTSGSGDANQPSQPSNPNNPSNEPTQPANPSNPNDQPSQQSQPEQQSNKLIPDSVDLSKLNSPIIVSLANNLNQLTELLRKIANYYFVNLSLDFKGTKCLKFCIKNGDSTECYYGIGRVQVGQGNMGSGSEKIIAVEFVDLKNAVRTVGEMLGIQGSINSQIIDQIFQCDKFATDGVQDISALESVDLSSSPTAEVYTKPDSKTPEYSGTLVAYARDGGWSFIIKSSS